jgi:tetratricopeptide (TPR) repeat protein
MNMSTNTARRGRIFPFYRTGLADDVELRRQLLDVRNLLISNETTEAAALAESLMEKAPYDVRVLALVAECYATKGEHEAAILVYDRLLTQQDSDVVWAAKARSLAALGRYRRASDCFARANILSIGGRFVTEQAQCLRAAGQLGDAIAILETATPTAKLDSKRCIAHAAVLAEIGQKTAAYKRANRAATTDQTGQAIALARQNMPDKESFAALCRQTAEHTASPRVIAALATDFPGSISKSQVDVLIQIAAGQNGYEDDQAQANLALFRIYDGEGDAFHALAHLRIFPAISAEKNPYKRGNDSALSMTLMRLKFEKLPASKSGLLPIFVTGLPGSGASRASAVLAQAANCGTPRALSVVPAIMSRFISKLRVLKSSDVTRDDLLALQSELRMALTQAAQGNDVIIDTTPSNFRWSGLLAAALPEARILQMTRDQMATGWALHKGGWSDPSLGCQHNLQHIQAYQHHSTALMRHWKDQFSPNVIEISGNAISRPGSGTAKAMVEACHLGWSNRCDAGPYSPDRSWHRYAAYLNPLRQPTAPLENLACDQSAK